MAAKRGIEFDPNAFVAMAGNGRSVGKYRKDQTVFSQGEPADAVFFIQKGRVKVVVVSEQGREAVVGILEANDFFGEACLAEQVQRLATVATMTDSVFMRLEEEAIVNAMHREPAFSQMFVAHVLNRNVRLEADLVDQLFNPSEKRLARVLFLLANFGKESNRQQSYLKSAQKILAEMEWNDKISRKLFHE